MTNPNNIMDEIIKEIPQALADWDIICKKKKPSKAEHDEWFEKWVGKALTRQKKEIEKAYGSCKKCYGKGYSTRIFDIIGSPDFIGDKGFKKEGQKEFKPCSCDRGKQFKQVKDYIHSIT